VEGEGFIGERKKWFFAGGNRFWGKELKISARGQNLKGKSSESEGKDVYLI